MSKKLIILSLFHKVFLKIIFKPMSLSLEYLLIFSINNKSNKKMSGLEIQQLVLVELRK